MLTPLQQSNFWAKINRREDDDCWLWTGCKTAKGYGSFKVMPKSVLATHIALAEAGFARPQAPNNHALHSDNCESRLCVNPNHLRWGSNAENMADMVRLGRQMRGETHNKAKLTAEQAAFIRQSTLPQSALISMFGLASSAISNIRRGKKWAGLAGVAVRADVLDRGETHSRAKLTEAQARQIKYSDEASSVLATRYGVAPQHVWQIRTGKKWAHIGEPG